MYKIRINNDLPFIWRFFTKEEEQSVPYPLEGKDITILLEDSCGGKIKMSPTISENVASWIFRGKDQKKLGAYTVTMYENEGKNGMKAVDKITPFELVRHQEEVRKISMSGCTSTLTIEPIEISTEFEQGGATSTSYIDLSDKPKINDVTLVGNKSLEDLGIASREALDSKQDELHSGVNIKTINGESILGEGNLSISGEPAAYIKKAVVSQDGNTLTLTKKDGSEVAFTRSSGGASVFIVVPYETTYEKVLQAYNAGNILIAKMANCYYPLQYATNSQFIFWGYGFLPGSGDDFWKWVINSDNEWSGETVSPEHYTTEYIPYGSNSIPSDREYKVSYTSISTQYGDIQFIPYHHSEATLYGRRYIFATIESGNLIKVFCEIETRTGLTNWSTTIEYIGNLISNASAGKTASDTIATYGNIVTHNTTEFATAAQGVKADTALQSVPSTYRLASAQDAIDNGIKGRLTDIEGKEAGWDAKADLADIPEVVDNVTSTSATKALSANQGKALNDRINNLLARGRFLSFWDATTGMPLTNPSGYPYEYHTGDYFIVNKVGATNYIPNGSTYTGQPSTTVYTGALKPNDSIYYDGTSWSVFDTPAGSGDIQDVYQNGASVVVDGIAYVVTPTTLAQLTGDSTHRVVTDIQITSWTSKQNEIGDLQEIRSGASLGATSVQNVTLDGTSVVSGGIASLTGLEKTSNKETTLTTSSTTKYPSSKGVADYVSDAISGKQDTISDLATIRSGAAFGATALQSESDPVFSASVAHQITTSETWTFTLSDNTTVTKTIPLI